MSRAATSKATITEIADRLAKGEAVRVSWTLGVEERMLGEVIELLQSPVEGVGLDRVVIRSPGHRATVLLLHLHTIRIEEDCKDESQQEDG